MAKVTSKLQVTIPKALAEEVGLAPGDDILWSASGDVLRLTPTKEQAPDTVAERLEIFDQASARQREREQSESPRKQPADRGWSREDLYDRGRSR